MPTIINPISGKKVNVSGTPGYTYGGVTGGVYTNPTTSSGNVAIKPVTSNAPVSQQTNPIGSKIAMNQYQGNNILSNLSGGGNNVSITPSWSGNATDYASLMSGLNSLNPGDINIDSTATGFTNTILSDYGKNTASALDYLQQSGQAGVSGYEQILNTLQGGVGNYLQNINKGAQAELGGIEGTLGYYKTLANRNQLPGQGIMEQNVQANTSQALNKVREFGGSSQGALDAITNLYAQQQSGMRDIGLNAANYQAQNQQNLAGFMGTVGGQRAGVYNRLGEAEMTGAQTTAQGQQMLTQAKQDATGNLADFYSGLAPQSANLLSGLMQQRLAAEQQQADLARRSILDVASTVGSGLQAQTQAQDQSYYYNQAIPYQTGVNFYNSLMGAGGQNNDLLGTAANMYNTSAQLQAQKQAGWTNAAGQVGSTLMNILGQYIMSNMGSSSTSASSGT